MTDVPAHNKNVDIRFIEAYPAHPTRATDPHYAAFTAAKKRMKAQGLYKCNVSSNYHWGILEAHHDKLEFSHINQTDLAKFDELYGLNMTDEEFQAFVEGPGNLEVLCQLHHVGQEGVHSLPTPLWNALRVAKDGENIVSVISNNDVPVIKNKESV
jgi:hypothetical protein